MRVVVTRAFVLVAILFFVVGCAHRRDMKAGDEFMEQGSYRAALGHYRAAQEKRPKSDKVEQRVSEAEQQVLEEALWAMTEAMEAGAVEEAVYLAEDTATVLHDPERLDELEWRTERIVLAQGEKRMQRRDFAEALALIDLHIHIFGDPLEPVAELHREVRATWEEELVAKARAQREEERYGAEALYLAQADFIGVGGGYELQAQAAAETVRRLDGWSVRVSSNLDERAQELFVDRAFEVGLPSAIADARRGDMHEIDAHIRLTSTEPIIEEWEERETRSGEFQSGTELVPNPSYEAEEQRLYQAEERARQAEQDLTQSRRQARDAERELRQLERQGRSTGFAESRLDSAYRDLDRRESAWESRRNDVERIHNQLRRIDRHIERPVYSEHYYEVILQHARLRSDVRIEVVAPEEAFEYVMPVDMVISAQSERHTAQPVLGLAGRDEPAPSKTALRADFETSLGDVLAQTLEAAFQDYRYRKTSDVERQSVDEKIDRLARFVLLYREKRDAEQERRLNELAGLEDGAELMIRIEQR